MGWSAKALRLTGESHSSEAILAQTLLASDSEAVPTLRTFNTSGMSLSTLGHARGGMPLWASRCMVSSRSFSSQAGGKIKMTTEEAFIKVVCLRKSLLLRPPQIPEFP